MTIHILILLGIVSTAGIGISQENLRWVLMWVTPTLFILLLVAEGSRLLYQRDKQEDAKADRWYFRLSEITYRRESLEAAQHEITVDLMISNRLDGPAGISHLILEANTKQGVPKWLASQGSEGKRSQIPDMALFVLEHAGDVNDLVPPLHFQPKEPKVGRLTFAMPDWDGKDPLLYIRDEDGTEYRIVVNGRTMAKIASTSRKEDYPK